MHNPKSHHPTARAPRQQKGGAGWGILAWLVGVPLPLILIAYLLKGCFGG